MKIRLGFVTNSSSSSYIIAKHEECTKEDIYKAFEEMREEIYSHIGHMLTYFDGYADENCEDQKNLNQIKELWEQNKKVEVVNFFIELLIKYFDSYEGIELKPWKVIHALFSNDNEWMEDDFLYYYAWKIKGSDKFKVINDD